MTAPTEPDALLGRTAYSADGDKLGKIGQVYVDDTTGEANWLTVATGLFGSRQSFAPVAGSSADGDDVRLAVTKDVIKNAPHIDADDHIDDDATQELYSYYSSDTGDDVPAAQTVPTAEAGPAPEGAPAAEPADDTAEPDDPFGPRSAPPQQEAAPEAAAAPEPSAAPASEPAPEPVPVDDPFGPRSAASQREAAPEPAAAAEPSAAPADEPAATASPTADGGAMTRSEEQVNVGTERVETGRARLRKYVVTEDVEMTVPVSHEELRVERVPVTEDNMDDAMSGETITESEHEVVLHEERPVVTTESVPVEQVRLSTETVTGEQTVSREVRKEQIDIDTPDAPDEQQTRG